MESLYWQVNRCHRKVFLGIVVGIRETIEMVWIIIGTFTFWNKDARETKCAEANWLPLVFIDIILCFGMVKLFMIGILCVIMASFCFGKCKRKRNERSRSKAILRSLQTVRFSALTTISGQPDEECIICYEEYQPKDTLTKLNCNTKHIFHSRCIEQWIQNGNNTCPCCRAPIANIDEINRAQANPPANGILD